MDEAAGVIPTDGRCCQFDGSDDAVMVAFSLEVAAVRGEDYLTCVVCSQHPYFITTINDDPRENAALV